MFDVGFDEMLMIAVVAIIVIGPKDLPMALRAAGRWVAKVRRVSGHFRSGIESMIREAELEEMERKWREQNEAIMKAHPAADPAAGSFDEPAAISVPAASAEAGVPATANDPAPANKAEAMARSASEAASLPPPP